MRELLVLQREHVELIPYLWVAHRGDECADRVRNLTIAFGFSRPNRIGTRHRAGCPCPQPPWIPLKCKHAATRGLSGVRKPSRRAQFPVPSEMTYALVAPKHGQAASAMARSDHPFSRLHGPGAAPASASAQRQLSERCKKATLPAAPSKGAKCSKWPSRSPLCPVTPQHADASAAGRNNPLRL